MTIITGQPEEAVSVWASRFNSLDPLIGTWSLVEGASDEEPALQHRGEEPVNAEIELIPPQVLESDTPTEGTSIDL